MSIFCLIFVSVRAFAETDPSRRSLQSAPALGSQGVWLLGALLSAGHRQQFTGLTINHSARWSAARK
jgi:hypothetical protein